METVNAVTVSSDSQYILVSTAHDRTVDDIRRSLDRVLELHQAHGIRRVLVDARGPHGPLTLGDAYDIGKLVAERVQGRLRLAIVLRQATDMHRLFETVTVNRGTPIQVFTAYDEAERWLTTVGP
jgi:hypothetical protein